MGCNGWIGQTPYQPQGKREVGKAVERCTSHYFLLPEWKMKKWQMSARAARWASWGTWAVWKRRRQEWDDWLRFGIGSVLAACPLSSPATTCRLFKVTYGRVQQAFAWWHIDVLLPFPIPVHLAWHNDCAFKVHDCRLSFKRCLRQTGGVI